MGVKAASKKIGMFIVFTVLALVLVPVLYMVMTSTPMLKTFGASNQMLRSAMIPFLMFRFSIYILIYIFYEPVTRHFTKRLKFNEADTNYALKRKSRLIIWIVGFEVVTTLSLISLMA